MSANRNLLLGVLALQQDFITREELIAGLQAWSDDKSKPVADLLETAGALDPTVRLRLETLVDKHLSETALQSTLSPASALQVKGPADPFATAKSIAPRTTGLSSAARSPSEGTRFQFVRVYREGGLGVVNIANDTELNREVALKEMKPHLAYDPSGRGRFIREAEITGGLEHPNIVPVYALSTYDDGRPFYAMRLIRGDTSLADEIESFHGAGNNPYAANQNVRLRTLLQRFISVCEAIEYAHSRGVLHRDLKPANIMLGKFGETLVVDWGLAKLLAAQDEPSSQRSPAQDSLLNVRNSDSTDETLMGSAVGTPLFMAPEQATGQLDLLGPATDVYGLGATLYALLTGQVPVDGKERAEVLANVREGKIVPPADRIRSIPRPLAAICQKALAKEPPNRYANAKDLAADIQSYLADEPVTAYREPITVRARRWARKHPAAISGALASTLVTILGLLIGFVVLGQKNRELAEKEAIATAVKDFLFYDLLRLADATKQAEAGIQVDPDLKVRTLLSRGNDLLASGKLSDQPKARDEVTRLIVAGLRSGDSALTVKEAILKSMARIDGRFRSQPLIEAELHRVVGNSLSAVGEFALSLTEYLRAQDLYSAELGPDHHHTLTSMNYVASAYEALGRLDEALPLYEKSLRLLQAKLGPEHHDTLIAMGNLANAYDAAGRLDEALQLKAETLRLRQAKFGPEDQETLSSMYELAGAYRRAGRLDEALPLSEETLRLMKAKLGPEHPHTLAALDNLAGAYEAVGRLKESISLYEESLRLMKAKLGPEHPHTFRSKNNLAGAYLAAGLPDKAVPLYEEALQFMKARLGPEHPHTLSVMTNLALAYVRAERLDEALPLYEETLPRIKAKLGPEHPNTLHTLNGLAAAYSAAGRWNEALPLLEETLRLMKAALGPEHPATLGSMGNLASAYQALGRLDEALQLKKETLRLMKEKLGPEHPDTLSSMNNLVSAYQAAGRLDDALSVLEGIFRLLNAKLGPEHPDTLSSMNELAWFLATVTDEELRDTTRAVEIAQAVVAASPQTAYYRRTLGIALYRAGAWQEAIAHLEAGINLRESADSERLYSAVFLAMAHWQLGEKDEARDWLKKAVQWMEQANANDADLKRFRAEAEYLIGE